MIPKGATICFVIGVISAGILGLYLYNITIQVPALVYQNGPSLSVIPDKVSYRTGEAVHIRVINSGTDNLTFSDSSFGLDIRGLDGTLIYSPPSTKSSHILSPHEERVFVWNQTRTGGGKVFEGRYQIESSAESTTGNRVSKSVTINIIQ